MSSIWRYQEDYGEIGKVWLYCDNISILVYEYVINGCQVRLVDYPEEAQEDLNNGAGTGITST